MEAITRAPPPMPDIDVFADRYRQLLGGFNVYCSTPSVADAVLPPRVHTFYRGLSFSYPAQVTSVGFEDVVFRIDPQQVDAVAYTGFAFITSPLHGTTFRAWSRDVDRGMRLATFSHFQRYRESPEQRRSPRVEPRAAVPVDVRDAHRAARGRLLDVSPVALAAEFDKAHGRLMQLGNVVRLRVQQLESEDCPPLETTAHISRVIASRDDGGVGCRAVMHLDIDAALRKRLEGYVLRRRRELLAEMRSALAT